MVANKPQAVQIVVQYAGTTATRAQPSSSTTSRHGISCRGRRDQGHRLCHDGAVAGAARLMSDLKLITTKPKVEDVVDTTFLDRC